MPASLADRLRAKANHLSDKGYPMSETERLLREAADQLESPKNEAERGADGSLSLSLLEAERRVRAAEQLAGQANKAAIERLDQIRGLARENLRLKENLAGATEQIGRMSVLVAAANIKAKNANGGGNVRFS